MKIDNGFRIQLESAINAIVIHSLNSYSWYGKLISIFPSRYIKKIPQETVKKHLSSAIQSQLYTDFYCKGLAVPSSNLKAIPVGNHVTPFIERLSHVNTGVGYFENWKIEALSNNDCVVYKNGLYLSVPCNTLLESQSHKLAAEMNVHLKFPKEFLHISPGFYVANSNETFSDTSQGTLIRFYFHFNPLGALKFVEKMTSIANKQNLPFSLKVIDNPYLYDRCDAAVLYIDKNYYREIRNILEDLYPDFIGYLTNGIPCFTKRLAKGIGLAEDPGNKESFGMNRCRILAEGIIEAYLQNKISTEDYLSVVENHFEKNGIKIKEPFLNPSSTDEYVFNKNYDVEAKLYNERLYSKSIRNAEYFSIANDIGNYLVETAVWNKDYCTWLAPFDNDGERTRYEALGPDFYSGTSGIALFLAELYALSGNNSFKIASLGSIKYALSHVNLISQSSRRGFYKGWVGIALAAGCIGKILQKKDILDDARALLNKLKNESTESNAFDIMDGNSGAICGLIILKSVLNDESLINLAIEYGNELLSSAEKSNIGFSWKSSNGSNHYNLTGFSNGTSGVGYALLELFRLTKLNKYAEGAQHAFNYERHWFDRNVNNWPDFRNNQNNDKRRKYSKQFSITWCHGAPGIALSRIRGYEILKDGSYKEEAELGINTIEKDIEQNLDTGMVNFSLCHGDIGNAEVLLQYNEHVAMDLKRNECIIDVALAGKKYTELVFSDLLDYRSKVNPTLMLGLAGIGHFYLRLIKPNIPSVLLLRPENF